MRLSDPRRGGTPSRFRRSPVPAALVALLLLLPLSLRAQELRAPSAGSSPAEQSLVRADLRGDVLSGDGAIARGLTPWDGRGSNGKKSPFLAAALSIVLPGAGEVYAESYWLAALFAGCEATALVLNLRYNKKGDDQTLLFEQYADAHWSLVKYAEWLNANAKTFPGGENTKPITIDPDESLPDWQRVNWDELHAVESAVPVFSHRLPAHGEQQYFELIGKYDQYAFGWDDKTAGYYRDKSPRFLEYAVMRGDANSFYDTATMWINLLMLNHVLSAVDAAWAAARFNKAVEMHSSVRVLALPGGYAELVPTATFTVHF